MPTSEGQLDYLRTYNASFILHLTKDLGWLHADTNAGLNLWRMEQAPLSHGFVSLALSVGLPRNGLMLESYGFSDAAPGAAADAGVLAAVCFSPRPWLILDLGTDVGLIQSTRSFSLFSGLTVIAADLWDTRPARLRGSTMAVESPSVAPRRLVPLLVTATCLTLALTLLTGVVYPAAVLLLSRLFPSEAAGSPLRRGEVVVGSALVGQGFAGPTYFHGRPSAAGSGYDGASSGGTNLGPLHPRLVDGTPDDPTTAGVDEAFAGVRALADAYRRDNGLPPGAPVPADAVTRSASGLDPHITPENAALQVPRVARRRGVDEARVRALVAAHTEGRTLGFLGEPRVAVLPLNLALDRFFPLAPGTR